MAMLTSFWSRHCLCIIFLAMLAGAQSTERQQAPSTNALVIVTEQLPRAFLRAPYRFELRAQGGAEPRNWKIDQGELPPGLELNPSGTLSGRPSAVGEFRFQVAVTDSGAPAQKQARWLVLRVVAPLP
jgi:hypothetical protein